MSKPQLEDVEISSQPEVKVDDSERFSALSWLCHHAGQMAGGSAKLLGLAVLGGLGYFARGVFSGTRKTKHKKDTAELEKPLFSPVAGNS